MDIESLQMEPESTFFASRSETWAGIDILLRRASPFSSDLHAPEAVAQVENFIRDDCPVLVIGAGGLGCELLKNLTLSGFRNIDVIDMDVVDVTNLNRQFLFTTEDVGKPKAQVAAEFINNRVAGANVKAHFADIRTFDLEFYSRFRIVVAGLDSIDARRWLNGVLVKLCETNDDGTVDETTMRPLVDGGTEGFAGQARVILPRLSACFECTLDLFPPSKNFPLCTIANTPRLPEHCIEYAHLVLWDQKQPFGQDKSLDTDNMEHMQWVYTQALQRAKEFNIPGVTYRLTQGVTKNIIPAIASTNAIIAASCANEALKIVSAMAKPMDNYVMYNGGTGVYTYTYKNEKRPDCPVCGVPKPLRIALNPQCTIRDVVTIIGSHNTLRCRQPVLRSISTTLYASHPPALEKATRNNLGEKVRSFFANMEELEVVVTDTALPAPRALVLYFDKNVPLPEETV